MRQGATWHPSTRAERGSASRSNARGQGIQSHAASLTRPAGGVSRPALLNGATGFLVWVSSCTQCPSTE